MHLTQLAAAVGQLRQGPADGRRAVLRDLLPHLERLAADDQVDPQTRTNIITRALRGISPRAPRPDTAAAAIAALRAALDADRGPGRPPTGDPHTIRVPNTLWDRVETYATRRRLSASAAAVELITRGLDGSQTSVGAEEQHP